MRKWSGTSTLRPLTTTSALGVGSGGSSSITIVVRSESTEWLDMLGNSFLYGVARFACPAWLSDYAPGGLQVAPPSGARCRVLTSYRWSAMLALRFERRREAFTGGCCRR